MPLPTASARKHLHTRKIEYTGYEREDGLFDLEGHMTDTKTYAYSNQWRGDMPPGSALHEMRVRLTVDENFLIKEVAAVTDNSPFEMCPDIAPNYESLVGIRIGGGWRKAIKERVGGTAGCTHLTELLFPMATVAFQTLMPFRRKKSGSNNESTQQKPMVLDTCHAWASDSVVVKDAAPRFYTGK